MAGGFKPLANGSANAALPNDGVGHRLSGRFFPKDGRFALIGNANRGNVGGDKLGLFQSALRRGELRLPDGLGVVLDVAGGRKDLRELLLRRSYRAAIASED